MSKIFVTQIPQRRDKETGVMIPSVNIAPAQEHGEVVVMLPSGANFYATSDLVSILANHLDAYDFDEGDALVALGDPAIIGAACAYLGKHRSKFTLLRWDRNLVRYLKVVIKV